MISEIVESVFRNLPTGRSRSHRVPACRHNRTGTIYCLLVRMLAVLAFAMGMQTSAHAAACTNTSGLPNAISYPGTVAVSSNLLPGDTIPGTVRTFSMSGTCTIGWGGPMTIQVGSSIVACTRDGGSTEVMPGVYTTGVSGVGMRLRNSSGTPIVNGSGQACFSSIAQIGAGGSYNFYGTLELVRISGPILNGSVMNNAAWAFGVYNTNGLLNDDSIDASQIYPAGAITLKSIACTPTFPAVVQLPTINQGALSAGSAGATAFAIGLRCDTGAQVGISLDAAAGLSVIDANNGILSVQTGGGGAWACRSSTNARFLCACSRASIWARSAPMCRTAFPLWRATFGSGP
jgi:hypothetical protein